MRGIPSLAPPLRPANQRPGGGGHDVSGALPCPRTGNSGQDTGDNLVATDLGWLQQLVAQRAEVPLVSAEHVAALLGVTVQRAYELLRTGAIPAVRIGRQVRVSPRALAEYIERGGHTLPGGWRREPA